MPKTAALLLAALLFVQAPAQAQVPSDTAETFAQRIDRFLATHPMPPRDPSSRRLTVEDIVDDLAPYLVGAAVATSVIGLIGAGALVIRRAARP